MKLRVNEETISLPENMEEVMKGVVIMRAGMTVASGFLISEDGYILTAAHVVSGIDETTIKLKSGLELDGQVIRVDEAQDIALVKILGKGHKALRLNTASLPLVGSEVYAIGSPLGEGLSFSVSGGIISGHRESKGLKYLQTDANLNFGNSGGPLINKKGEVVGIVSWKITATGVEGLSFGIPLEIVAERLGINWIR